MSQTEDARAYSIWNKLLFTPTAVSGALKDCLPVDFGGTQKNISLKY